MLDGRVKTLHPRIHGGLLADRRKPEHVDQLAEHGIEPFDLVVVQPLPVPRDGRGRRRRRRGDREDRHRRAGDGSRRREELRVGGRGRRSGRYEEVLDELRREGGLLERRAGARPRRRSPTRPPTTPPSPAGSPTRRRRRFAARVRRPGATRRSATSATARTRTSAARCTRSGRPPASARRRRVSAGQGDVVQQLARCRRRVRAGGGAARRTRRDREAQQPVRRGGRGRRSAESYRTAFACDTVSAFGGIVAFHATCDARRPPRRCADVFTEVVVAPSFTATRSRRSRERPEPPGGGGAAARRGGPRCAPDAGWRARAGPRRRRPRRARSGRSSRLASRPTRSGATCARVDRRVAGEVEHHRAGAGRRHGRGRGGTDVARGRVVDRGAEGRGPSARARRGERRLLPVPRRAGGRGRRGRAPPSSTREARRATRTVLAAAEARGMAVVLTGRATSVTEAAISGPSSR